ncbi:MAG: FtsW/RodA/SpoVE family cell cycle protein [Hungatella sp.]
MILMIAVYTYLNFRFFGVSQDRKDRICISQNVLMFLLHALAYAVLYLNTKNEKLIVFYGAQVIFFFCYLLLYRLLYVHVSRILLNNMCMLLCVGMIMLTRLSPDKAVRQFAIIVISAGLTWLIPYVIDRVWQLGKITWPYAAAGIVLLLTVLIAGNNNYGAQLSLSIAGFSFQPTEIVKITFVFFVAAMFYQSVEWKQVYLTTAAAAVHVLILVLSKDLGSALMLAVTYLLMLFVATSSYLFLGVGILSGCGAAVAAYHLFAHVRVRVEAWLNPWADIDKNGYQITQSLFAMGTGGWFGMGLCQGMPKKIPVVEKDFIFAAVSEEMGGIFAVCVLLICVGCFLQFIMIATRMQAMFFKLLAFGLGILYAVQVVLAVGGVIKFIPSTGVTLPFVSYGGSSILSTFVVFGIIQGMYILKGDEEEDYELEQQEY